MGTAMRPGNAQAAMRTARSVGRGEMSGADRESVTLRRLRLLRVFRENGDLSARDELAADCLPLIASLAWSYAVHGEQLEDLIQVGSIGLLKAIERFEFDRGVDFMTYAMPVISGEIRHHVRDNVRLVRIPRPVRELYARLFQVRDELTSALGREPTNLELAKAAEVEEAEVLETLQARFAFQPVSLSAVSGSGEEHDVPLVESISAEDEGYEAAENRLLVASLLERLSLHERRVLHLRYYRDLTQARIGAELGLTQMQVSRILRKAVENLAAGAEAA